MEWVDPGNMFPRAIRFSADGKRLAATVQGGKRISIFDVDPDSWRERARLLAGMTSTR